uniref:Uncharacterized protein n=1 Tax=Panstrongylus megistus TaxID=65343 RepID=A0A069DS24_9HEMI
MSLYDIFRRAFGINSPYDKGLGQPGFRNPIWEEESDDDEDELDDEFSSHYRYAPNTPFGFRIFSGDVMDMHKYFEQQMDEMIKNFHSSLFGSDLLQLPESSFGDPNNRSEKENIPNKYLKPWVEQSLPENDLKQDTDIDGSVTAGDLRKIFPNEEEENVASSAHVPSKVFGQSVITRIIRTADGRLEKEKRVHGSDGREEVSLVRQIGDQKYKVITKKDGQTGVTDTTEELINLDEEKLAEFNRKWEEQKSNRKSTSNNLYNKDKIISIYPPENNDNTSNISLSRLFEKWFK